MTPRLASPTEMIELTDTTSSEIAAEFVRARTRAGSPAMGMVMTLIIVVDEDDARRDGRRPGASHEHPARVLGVILGDAAAPPTSTPRSAPAAAGPARPR